MSDASAAGTQDTTQAGGTQTTDQAATGAPADVANATAAGAPDAGKPQGDDAKPQGDAEITYSFTAPEGVELDKVAVEEFTALAKELKLPAEKAQAAVNLVAAMRQREADAHAEQVAGWAEALKTDKDFGGEQFDANVAVAKQALDKFGTPDMKALLNQTGLGNHPEVVKLLWKVGQAISEDKAITGSPASAAPIGEAALQASLYDKTPA